MIFCSLDTIKDLMTTSDRVRWTVFDSQGDVLREFDPDKDSCTPDDSYNELTQFLGGLRGNGYVVIKVYSKNYKGNAGGELKKLVRAFNYAIGNYGGGASGLGGLPQRGEVADTITELKVMMAEMRKDKEIEKLTRELDSLKSERRVKPSFFEGAITGIGTEFAKEMLKQQGYAIEGLDEENDGVKVYKKPVVDTTAAPAAKSVAAVVTPKDNAEISKMLIDSNLQIIDNLKPFGIAPTDVAKTMAELAAISKSDPLKFKALLIQLGITDET